MCFKCWTGSRLPQGVNSLGIQNSRRYFTKEDGKAVFLNSLSISPREEDCGLLGKPALLPQGTDIKPGDEVPLWELYMNLLEAQKS